MRVVQTFEERQQSAEECLHLFSTRKHAAFVGLRHAHIEASAGIRHAYATLSLLSCRVVNVVLDPATVYCGQRYNLKAKLPGGGKFWKKTQKVMLKIRFGKGKNGP